MYRAWSPVLRVLIMVRSSLDKSHSSHVPNPTSLILTQDSWLVMQQCELLGGLHHHLARMIMQSAHAVPRGTDSQMITLPGYTRITELCGHLMFIVQ